MISEVELHEVEAAIPLNVKELLLLVKHPSQRGEGASQMEFLLAEPFPITSIEDQEVL